jgi:hypothetical protein
VLIPSAVIVVVIAIAPITMEVPIPIPITITAVAIVEDQPRAMIPPMQPPIIKFPPPPGEKTRIT